MSNLYVTAAEAQNWPTGLDLQNLVPDGSAPEESAQLAVVLYAASSYVEQIVFQPLYARTVTETAGDARTDGAGRLQVRLRSFPCASVSAAQWQQSTTAGWTSIPPGNIHVIGALQQGYYADDLDYRVYSGWGRPPFTVMTQYAAGWANAVLTAPSPRGATTLTVDDAAGIVASSTVGAMTLPGTTLTIYDAANVAQESVAVQSVSGSVVTLAAPTLYGHTVGTRASALPSAVTVASIYLAAQLIKERRAGGGTLMSGHVLPADGDVDLRMARDLLLPFRRVV